MLGSSNVGIGAKNNLAVPSLRCARSRFHWREKRTRFSQVTAVPIQAAHRVGFQRDLIFALPHSPNLIVAILRKVSAA
jgi:hypothetical protein